MLTIRDEQIKAFLDARQAALPGKVTRYLRQECGDETKAVGDRELEAAVRQALARAAERGLAVEWDLCRFCWMTVVHGPRFDEELDWAREILGDSEGTGTEKMDLVEAYHLNHLTK